MAYTYVEASEILSDKLPDLNAADDDVVDRITRLAESVSATIDRFCDRPAGYFTALAEPSDPTSKFYRGRNMNLLQIGRHVLGNIHVTGIADTAFYENPENGWLYESTATGSSNNISTDRPFNDGSKFWDSRLRYEVVARWGFAEVPADIKEAVKLIVEQIANRGEGVIGQVTPAGFVIERDMPLTARTMLEPWIKREFEVE